MMAISGRHPYGFCPCWLAPAGESQAPTPDASGQPQAASGTVVKADLL